MAAYNTDQNCNAESVMDPVTLAIRPVDHYTIDELIGDDLNTELELFLLR